MRSFELPLTPFFIQPLRVAKGTPWKSWSHSTARDENYYCPRTFVLRLGPVGLAFGRWRFIDEEDIQIRAEEEIIRSWFTRYNAFNDPVSWRSFCRAWFHATVDPDWVDLEDDELMGALQALLVPAEADSVEA